MSGSNNLDNVAYAVAKEITELNKDQIKQMKFFVNIDFHVPIVPCLLLSVSLSRIFRSYGKVTIAGERENII